MALCVITRSTEGVDPMRGFMFEEFVGFCSANPKVLVQLYMELFEGKEITADTPLAEQAAEQSAEAAVACEGVVPTDADLMAEFDQLAAPAAVSDGALVDSTLSTAFDHVAAGDFDQLTAMKTVTPTPPQEKLVFPPGRTLDNKWGGDRKEKKACPVAGDGDTDDDNADARSDAAHNTDDTDEDLDPDERNNVSSPSPEPTESDYDRFDGDGEGGADDTETEVQPAAATASPPVAIKQTLDELNTFIEECGAHFLTNVYIRGCHWFPRLLACSLEENMRVTNAIPFGCPLIVLVHTVNYV
jgi:hypothetical protein